MVDFEVYRTAAHRALAGEPLYRAEDGHYQFKYLPAFALAMAPFALVDREAAKVIWFALSAGLLTAFVRWSVRALPERRRSERALLWLTVLFMAKFYAHELTLGQTNILLGVAARRRRCSPCRSISRTSRACCIGAAAFVKPYALLLLPWLGVHLLAPRAALVRGVGARRRSASCRPSSTAGPATSTCSSSWFHDGQRHDRRQPARRRQRLAGRDVGQVDRHRRARHGARHADDGRGARAWSRPSGCGDSDIANPDYLEFALLMLLVPLLSPQGWDYVLLLGTPAVVCLLDRWSEVSREWRVATALSLALMGLTIFDVMGRTLYARFMALSIVSVAALGAAVALTHLRWKALG